MSKRRKNMSPKLETVSKIGKYIFSLINLLDTVFNYRTRTITALSLNFASYSVAA